MFQHQLHPDLASGKPFHHKSLELVHQETDGLLVGFLPGTADRLILIGVAIYSSIGMYRFRTVYTVLFHLFIKSQEALLRLDPYR